VTFDGDSLIRQSQELSKLGLNDLEEFKKACKEKQVERILPGGPNMLSIRSVSDVANILGKPVEELAARHALLSAVSSNIDNEHTSSKNLLMWLDSYFVRGSFDDRTLVILHEATLK
jgi:hypothetical protein